jgi:hypothetical protein
MEQSFSKIVKDGVLKNNFKTENKKQFYFKKQPEKRIILFKNYIPHKKSSNFNSWQDFYQNELIMLYNIMIKVVENYDIEPINWVNPNIIEQFNKFIYDSSSKYILI